MKFDVEKFRKMAVPASEEAIKAADERHENREARRYSALIALAVRRELRLKGLTQQSLAERMGVSAQYVGKILKGTENLTLDTIGRLERALEHHLLKVVVEDQEKTVVNNNVFILAFDCSRDDYSELRPSNEPVWIRNR